MSDFGIVANVVEVDRVFRLGSKAWIANGTGGVGWERFVWLAASRSGRQIIKWAPTSRFGNFRAKFIPPPISQLVTGYMGTRGTREEMEALAEKLNAFAAKLREEHLLRGGQLSKGS